MNYYFVQFWRLITPTPPACQVKIRNITIESAENTKNGKCVELEDCDNFEITHCSLKCFSETSDLAPYPARWTFIQFFFFLLLSGALPDGFASKFSNKVHNISIENFLFIPDLKFPVVSTHPRAEEQYQTVISQLLL